MADFAGILLKNLGEISSEYEKKAHFTEISWGKKERNRFCAVFMNVFNETKWQFCQFFFFFGRGKWWALACAVTTTTETSTSYKLKCCLFKTTNFVLEALACIAISFGLGIVSHKVFFFLSEIIICSFNNNELRNAPMAKIFISCTGQCSVFLIII